MALHAAPERAGGILDLHLEAGKGAALAAADSLDAFEIEIGRCASQTLERDAAHLNLLHQFLVIGIQRIEPMDLGMFGPVRGGIAQHEERSEEHTSELQSLMRKSYAVF